MTLLYSGMPSDLAAAYRAGAPDANGQAPERRISDGDGVPCRHCLENVAAGEPYLVLAYRPFPAPQPESCPSSRSKPRSRICAGGR